jgi:hypothetical protein
MHVMLARAPGRLASEIPHVPMSSVHLAPPVRFFLPQPDLLHVDWSVK